MAQKRPRAKELRVLYRGLVTTSVATRIAVLCKAVQWYDLIFDRFSAKHTFWAEERLQLAATAIKTRALGISVPRDQNNAAEREVALRKTIELYEKLFAKQKLPKVGAFYARYEERKGRLESQYNRAMEKYGTVLNTLNQALAPKDCTSQLISLTVGGGSDESRQYDFESKQVTYGRQHLKQMRTRLRTGGLLDIALSELAVLGRYCAMQPDGAGGYAYDVKRHLDAVLAMQQALLSYCQGPNAPKRVARGGTCPRAGKRAAGGNKGAGFGNREKVAGLYAVGGAYAVAYELLQDQQWYKRTDLPSIRRVLRRLKRDGKLTGKWQIEEDKTLGVHMVLSV